jgi:hypothetical protein
MYPYEEQKAMQLDGVLVLVDVLRELRTRVVAESTTQETDVQFGGSEGDGAAVVVVEDVVELVVLEVVVVVVVAVVVEDVVVEEVVLVEDVVVEEVVVVEDVVVEEVVVVAVAEVELVGTLVEQALTRTRPYGRNISR